MKAHQFGPVFTAFSAGSSDAAGNPRARFVRIRHDGSACIVPPQDVADFLGPEAPADYQLQDVFLSAQEFEALPEFGGF